MKARFFAHHTKAREIIAMLVPYARHLEPMLQLEGITVTVEKYRKKRTLPQNSRYWAIVSALGKHVGCTSDQMHDEVLCAHFGYEYKEWQGEHIKVPLKRSSDLVTTDFSELMDVAERWAVAEGVFWEDAA